MSQPSDEGFARLTVHVAEGVQSVADRVPTGTTFGIPPSANLCSALELFLPLLLRRQYAEWANESLDGIFVARATKTDEHSINIVGTCILISDQTVTPFMLDVAVDATPRITSVRLQLGERGGGPLRISGPGCHSAEACRMLDEVPRRADTIDWIYKADGATPDPVAP